jgi:hypothetical protein
MLSVAPSAGQTPLTYGTLTLPTGASPSAARIGDLDGDSRNDIAAVTLPGNLQLYYGNGAGGFQQVSMSGLWPANQAMNLAIGDLTGDGKHDIAVALATPNGAVSILRNLGNRTFASPVTYTTCSGANSVAIGDLDRDGDNDLAVTGGCSQAAILLNNGQGVFSSGGSFGTGSFSRAVALADFNRDGFLDISYLNAAGRSEIMLLFNNGSAEFGNPKALFAGDLAADFTVSDVDGDRAPDLVIANPTLGQVIILFNDNALTFQGYTELTLETPDSIAAADFNDDLKIDVAAGSRSIAAVSILLQRDRDNFNAGGTHFWTGQNPIAITAGKLDADGRADVVAVNQSSGTLTVALSALPPPPPPPPPPVTITLTLSTRLTSTARWVDLRWTGATASWLDIYRNGSRITTVYNTGSHSDRFSRQTRGTFQYRVCHAGSTICSNQASITF